MQSIGAGDIVKSLKGKDKGVTFLVVRVNQGYAEVVDGKVRRVTKLKKKNIKHLLKVEVDGLTTTAIRIQRGEPVGNQRLKKQIKATTNKN